jgi:DNA helicase INO80
VQDIVVGNKTLTDVAKPSEIVQLLLNDEQLAGLDTATAELSEKNTGKAHAITDRGGEPVRDLWNEEGDDFFGHVVPPVSTGTIAEAVEDPVPGTSKGKKKKKTAAGASKGSKPGAQQASRRKAAFTPRNDTPDES